MSERAIVERIHRSSSSSSGSQRGQRDRVPWSREQQKKGRGGEGKEGHGHKRRYVIGGDCRQMGVEGGKRAGQEAGALEMTRECAAATWNHPYPVVVSAELLGV